MPSDTNVEHNPVALHNPQHAAGHNSAHNPVAPLDNISEPLLRPQEFNITFKKDELGNKRDSFKVSVGVPTLTGLVTAMQDEKTQNFVLSLVKDEIYRAVRAQIADADEATPIDNSDKLDHAKLTVEFLANMPEKERTGGGISKETWAAWAADYMEIMPAAAGRSKEAVEKAAKIFVGRLQTAKNTKPVLKFLEGQLSIWLTHTKNAEEFSEVAEFLMSKIDTFMKLDDAALLANLES